MIAAVLLLSMQSGPPKGAVVLFDGKSTTAWRDANTGKECRWSIKDGALEVNVEAGDVVTVQKFGDYRLHLEFWLPKMTRMTGQNRANSGIYNHGLYEVQVLDSWNNPTYRYGGCGALYGEKDPDRKAILPPERWNSYDIVFRAPRFNPTGRLTERPQATVWHNGILIHDRAEFCKALEWAALQGPVARTGPLRLQNHWCPVRYRNIWIVPLATD